MLQCVYVSKKLRVAENTSHKKEAASFETASL